MKRNQKMLQDKLFLLQKILKDMESVVIAYSGGVDSSLLIKTAYEVLKDKVLAVTATSLLYPKAELKCAKQIAKQIGVKHIIIHTKELKNAEFINNPPNRCYICKKELYERLIDIQKKNNFNYVADATNFDDINDYRPGIEAAKELNIRSPLYEAQLRKSEIRKLAKKLNLNNWDKAQQACLASRICYFEKITAEKLKMIEEAERFLHNAGVKHVRVRHHENNLARIETDKTYFPIFFQEKFINKLVKKFKKIGYKYISFDLEGYRMGSLNLNLKK